MPNANQISLPMVVAGVIGKYYLINGSRVHLIKFSTTTRYYGKFNSLEELVEELIKKENDDTSLKVKVVENVLANENDEVDVVLISDFIFSSREVREFSQVVNSYENVKRAYLFVYNKNKRVKEMGKLKVMYVSNFEDILDVVIK